MSFIPLSKIKKDLSNLVPVTEKQYNRVVEKSLAKVCDFTFVDCHEYGEAYYIDGHLVAYHEIECISHSTYYLLPHII